MLLVQKISLFIPVVTEDRVANLLKLICNFGSSKIHGFCQRSLLRLLPGISWGPVAALSKVGGSGNGHSCSDHHMTELLQYALHGVAFEDPLDKVQNVYRHACKIYFMLVQLKKITPSNDITNFCHNKGLD